MKNLEADYQNLSDTFLDAGFDPVQDYYVIGETYVDDYRAIWADDCYWYVGSCERGKKHETSRFKSSIDAAEYLMFLILAPALKNGKLLKFPGVNWK